MSDINELKKQLSNEFEMKDLGAAKKYLAWKYPEIDHLEKYI